MASAPSYPAPPTDQVRFTPSGPSNDRATATQDPLAARGAVFGSTARSADVLGVGGLSAGSGTYGNTSLGSAGSGSGGLMEASFIGNVFKSTTR